MYYRIVQIRTWIFHTITSLCISLNKKLCIWYASIGSTERRIEELFKGEQNNRNCQHNCTIFLNLCKYLQLLYRVLKHTYMRRLKKEST